RPRVAKDQIAGWIAHRLEQRLGESRRQRNTERVAIARDILDRDVSPGAGQRQRYGPPLVLELVDRGGHVRDHASRFELLEVEITDSQQQIVQAVLGPD